MRDSITRLCIVAVAGLFLAGCSWSDPAPATPRPKDAASIAAERAEAARADATRRLQELESGIEDARRRIADAETRPSLSKQERRVLSETRRAVVVANVSLQKARTAVAAGDYAGASQATEGAADKLKSVAEGKSVTSVQAPGGETK